MTTINESINQLDDSSDDIDNAHISVPFDQWPEVMSHKQIMEFVGLSHKQAWTALSSDRIYRPFPDKRRNMIVGKFALRDFLNGRIIEKEDLV